MCPCTNLSREVMFIYTSLSRGSHVSLHESCVGEVMHLYISLSRGSNVSLHASE